MTRLITSTHWAWVYQVYQDTGSTAQETISQIFNTVIPGRRALDPVLLRKLNGAKRWHGEVLNEHVTLCCNVLSCYVCCIHVIGKAFCQVFKMRDRQRMNKHINKGQNKQLRELNWLGKALQLAWSLIPHKE